MYKPFRSFCYQYISGSRLERAQTALHKIGPAVTNGGLTTFLAVVLLCDSKSHAFITFFKVFFLSVVFGLYHALVFLPVILSLETPFQFTSKYKAGENQKQQNAEESSDNKTCKNGENNNLECSNTPTTTCTV